MQIPMEILSPTVIRADSGNGGWNKSSQTGGSSFDSVMESVLEETPSQQLPASPTQGSDETTTPENELSPDKPNEKEEPDANLVAAVMTGIPHEVVIILERDMESATTPAVRVESDDLPELALKPEITAEKPEELKQTSDRTCETELTAPTKSFGEAVKEASKQVKDSTQTQYAQTTETATAETLTKAGTLPKAEMLTKAETAQADAQKIVKVSGEVTARTPEIRMSDLQGTQEQRSELSRKGDLSPLENDNVRTKGQQQPGFSQALSSAREEVTAQQTAEQTAAQLPLADGIKPEQFTAEQQMKQTALDTPIKAENLFDEMVSRLETMQTEQTRTMTIHLRPEFLGKVAMELAMDAAGLHVKINAADAGVRAMINSQVTALIESLENKGIEVVEVEVAYTGVDNGAFKEKRDDTSQSNNKRRLRREINAADGAAYYTVQQYESSEYYLEAGVSSVEYSA